MYFFDLNEIDEKTLKDLKKLLEYYYSGLIYDDETLQKFVEEEKNLKVKTIDDDLEQKNIRKIK